MDAPVATTSTTPIGTGSNSPLKLILIVGGIALTLGAAYYFLIYEPDRLTPENKFTRVMTITQQDIPEDAYNG